MDLVIPGFLFLVSVFCVFWFIEEVIKLANESSANLGGLLLGPIFVPLTGFYCFFLIVNRKIIIDHDKKIIIFGVRPGWWGISKKFSFRSIQSVVTIGCGHPLYEWHPYSICLNLVSGEQIWCAGYYDKSETKRLEKTKDIVRRLNEVLRG